MAPPLNITQCATLSKEMEKKVGCYLHEIDQTTDSWAIFGQKTGYKLQYIVKNGGQNKVIIAKKSNIIHHFEIAHKTVFFSTRIMAPSFFK